MRTDSPAVDARVTLVDTSIWVHHAFHPESKPIDLLQVEAVYSHTYAAGELAMGTSRNREDYLLQHRKLLQAIVVSAAELLDFVRIHRSHGRCIDDTDAHLLASAKVMANTQPWTRDKRLVAAAKSLGLFTVAEYSH